MDRHYLKQERPINDALRRTVVEDLPELAEIKNEELRRLNSWHILR